VAPPRRRLSASWLITSPILFVLATALVVQSIRALASFAGDANTRDLAASIERGVQPDPAYLSSFISNNGLDRGSTDCGDAVTRARLTVSLAALDAAIKGSDLASIDVAKKNALEIVKHRLNCNPLDGNAWLRLAMIEAQSSGALPGAVDALRLSYWSAPSESWVMEARLSFATRLYLADVPGFETEYLEDLRRFATYEPTNQVAKTYAETASRIKALLHPLIVAQPEPRKKAMVAEIDRLGLLFDAR
jgi:hypothetical protein